MYKDLKIFIAVPSFDKKLFMNCHQSLMNALQVLINCGIPFQFSYEVGLPYISMARNNLVRKFMESDCTDMVFIDADVGFAPGAFHDLIVSKEELIGGAYPKKQDGGEEFAVRLARDENGNAVYHEGVLRAEGLATGFMKIKRSVFDKLREAHPELLYSDGMTGKATYNFFGEFIKDGRVFYDDFGFSHLWDQLGGMMWVLPNITFSHAGGKNFEGNLHEHLTRQRPEGIIKALKIDGFMTEEELTWLYTQAQRMNDIIEVGSWKGRSTTALLEGCRGTVIAVDNWTGHDPASTGLLEDTAAVENVHATFMKNVGYYDNLVVERGNSPDVAEQFNDLVADMVFIDGEHTYEGCKADIEAWLPKARRMIAFHDFSSAWPGVMRAVNEKFGTVKTVGTIAYVELGG